MTYICICPGPIASTRTHHETMIMKCKIWVDPFLDIIIKYSVCLSYAQQFLKKKTILKKKHKCYTFYPKIMSPWGGGHDILCLLLLQDYVQNMKGIDPWWTTTLILPLIEILKFDWMRQILYEAIYYASLIT